MNNERYRKILESAIEVERENEHGWRLDQVGATGGHISKLKAEGLVKTVIERSSKSNWYKLTDREEVEKALEEIEEEMKAGGVIEHDWDIEPPSFDSVVGLDDMKFILRKALTADDRVNVLLAGPPSLGKSVLLMEIEQAIPNAEFGYGSEDSAAGLIDMLFDKQPQVLLIDELDEMDSDDYSVIEQLGEHGRVTERKYGKTREIELDTRIFAACNDLEVIPSPVKSRFQTMTIEPYSESEFLEVVTKVLNDKEDCSEQVAAEIADRVYHEYDSDDIRDAIRVSRMVDAPEEVEGVITALQNHS